MAQWIGFMVSIKCVDDLGTYQGEISEADPFKITLTKAFCNGFPCDGQVLINASDIVDLKLIEKQIDEPQENSTVTVAKPVAKRAHRSYSTSDSVPKQGQIGVYGKSKPIDIDLSKKMDESLSLSFKNNTPNKRSLKGGKWMKGWKDEECFGSPVGSQIKEDFDFEKNLALFDKQAIWDELNAQKPDVIRQADSKKVAKYRHDENIIASQPTSFRQIVVPKQDFCEYVTDDGLIIPCISRSLKKKLFEAAGKAGLTFERQIELFGSAAAEISIHLIGGSHRLNPSNSHQLPTVVVLCGPHQQGAAGANAARQLTSHGVRTVLYYVSSEATSIRKELALYSMTRNRTVTNIADLPQAVDLIICALCEDTETPMSYPLLAEWINKNKAPVLALDPPSCGIPGIFPKISLLPVLPLPHSPSNGKLYLTNLAFPVEIYHEVGIKYQSPFGSKNTIPLHPNE
ncbi:enhancer of mRNA-decapping protein 3 [Sitophilus oryzae]|uniref:Enhancer of mRNA-decapping protein 3 n=1 Tax=Sitophilus oryzae TaxID=7048 RepID=A0A6J2XBN2_SITOR|nr:enhancer of mRNA-decapping protein 3 [Sitophilus oryzae]